MSSRSDLGCAGNEIFSEKQKKGLDRQKSPRLADLPVGQISEAFSSSLRGVHHPTLRATRSLTTASASRLKKILMEAPNTTTK
jgi:hypothetical protein